MKKFMRLFCWLGFHKWASNCVGNAIMNDLFCVRIGCLASKSMLSGKVYSRKPTFTSKG